jgi:hypothetical protein
MLICVSVGQMQFARQNKTHSEASNQAAKRGGKYF